MNISAYFIRNPIPAILLFIMLSFAGWIGYSNMTVKLMPDIDVPIIIVTVPVPGGAPEQLETEVARKIEDKLVNLNGLKHTRSTLVDNAATIIAEFNIEKNSQEALDEVRSAVNEVRGDLPSSAESPIVTKVDTNEMPLFIYSISSSNMDVADLSWFVDNDLSKMLLGVKGVGSITRIGGVEREVQVLLDPTTLQAYQTTVSDVSQQIKRMQQNFSGGEADLGGLKQPIRTIAAVQKPKDLEDLRISLANGRMVKLSDIATIKDTYKAQTSKAVLDETEGVAFIVRRAKGFGDLDVGHGVQDQLADINRRYPHLTITEVFETMSFVEQDFSGSMTMLGEGAMLAVFVVLLFLGGMRPTVFFAFSLAIAYYLLHSFDASWAKWAALGVVLSPVVLFFNRFRATLVAAVALPLSILPAFAGMYFLDVSLNSMATLALSLVIGILVDDAIVEIENIDRHMNMGKTPYNASIDAADEIGTAVIAITSTLIAVFLPTAFMPGIPGKFFYQFGVAASLAIFSSLLVARIITPMLCAYFLKPTKHHTSDPFWMKPYLWLAKTAIKLRWLTLLLALGFFGVSMMGAGMLPFDFIPKNDASFTQVTIELPPGGKLDKTEAVTNKTINELKDIEGVKQVFAYIGQQSERKATLFFTFTKRGTRPQKKDIENIMREQLSDIAGARFSVMSGANGEKYDLLLSSPNKTDLARATQAIIEDLRTIDGLGSISNSSGLTRQELMIYPNYTKAAERGVSSAAIAQAIRVATVGDFDGALAKFNSEQRQIPIVVRLPDYAKSDINILNDLIVMGTKGPVRIGDVARLDIDTGPLEIRRYDRERFVELVVEIKSGAIGEITEKIKNLPSVKNLPSSVKTVVSGDAEIMEELVPSFMTAMAVGVLCILFVLILLFGKISQPFTILVALPLSIGGAVAGLMLTNSGMSLPAMIGLLMLMGIAVKNSILLVEYVIEYRKGNPEVSRIDALLDACHKRARPIIMTTIAMGAGMLPLIIGIGEADPSFRRPMAASVFGGLITSTFLSLIVIPAFYTIIEDFSNLLANVFGFIFRGGKRTSTRAQLRNLEQSKQSS